MSKRYRQWDAHSVAETLWQELDEALVDAERRRQQLPEAATAPIACKAGCGMCCSYVVQASTVEAERIALHVESQPEPERTRLLNRLFGWVRSFDHFLSAQQALTNPAATLRGKRPQLTMNMRLVARWQVRRAACPFLDMDTQTCGIYKVRPIECRSHIVLAPQHPEDFSTPTGEIPLPGPQGCVTTTEYVREGRASPVPIPAYASSDKGKFGGQTLIKALEASEALGLGSALDPLAIAVAKVGMEKYRWTPRLGETPPQIPLPT